MENGLLDTYVSSFPLPLEALYKNHDRSKFGQIVFKGLRLTAGRRPTWVCVGLGRAHVKLSGAYWALGGAKVGNWSASEMGALY